MNIQMIFLMKETKIDIMNLKIFVMKKNKMIVILNFYLNLGFRKNTKTIKKKSVHQLKFVPHLQLN